MDWYAVLGILSAVLPLCAMVPYVRDILARKSKPNIISWLIWTVVILIVGFGQVAEGLSWSAALIIGSTLQNLVIIFLCLAGYGYQEWRRIDIICLVIALIAILLWALTSNALIAILLAILADAVAYIPTYAKILRAPKSETYVFWGTLTFADTLAIFSVAKPTLANISFPIAYVILNIGIFVMAFFGRRFQKRIA